MPMRVAMLSAECEPWAKTGGLADVVDALARALGRLSGEAVETPVDVFLPRYRIVPEPQAIERTQVLSVPDPISETQACMFAPRCAHAIERCRGEVPRMRTAADGRKVACHRFEELA